ncbi:hypothetical protein FMM55_06295 [Campylobacter sp. LR196d]|nr:hypothetical protein FMM57_07620 [Campylobacter sp. LR286c]KAA6225861.1 hypothetical protein FMM55_06295 [Campylobacter sp. LR196d]
MNKYLEQLVFLSKIDQEIDSFEPKIEDISKALRLSENKINKINTQLSQIDDEIKDIEQQKVQNNNHIAEFNAKIKELSKKSALIKTEREANALKVEEGIAKEQLKAADTEIIRLDELLSNKQGLKNELLEQKTKEEEEFTNIQTSIQKQINDIEKERMVVYDKKTKLVGDINQRMLSFYEKIRKWAKNTAVIPVRKQACYGCFMRIYDKTYLDILKGEEIVTCPHCGRILYIEDEKAHNLISKKEEKKESKSTKKASTKTTTNTKTATKAKATSAKSTSKTDTKSTKSTKSVKTSTKSKSTKS